MSIYRRQKRYFRKAYETGQHGWPIHEPSRFVVRFLKSDRGRGRVLDLGCGEGRHTLLLAGAGYDAVGVDYEPLAIRRAKRIASERGMTGRCRFMVADGFRLPFPNGSFDVLVDFGCLHHIRKSDFDRYLSRVIPLLKSGGRFLLSCFSVKFKHHPGERRRRDWLVHRGHYDRFFRKDEFRKLFGAQFRIRRIEEERNGTYVFWNVLMEKV